MPIPYIWFGNNNVFDANGKIIEATLNASVDKWTVVALLGWDSQSSTFTPALLVRSDVENPVLNKLLEFMGAKPDSVPEIPTGW